jgi:glycosyltransferase involved in cell wall biosynthesis
MKVLLIGNYVHDRQFSMQLFANILSEGLLQAGIEVELLRPEPIAGNILPGKHGLGKWLGYLDKYLFFPKRLRAAVAEAKSGGRPTIVHICDQGNSYYRHACKGLPVLITCHDLIAIMGAFGGLEGAAVKWTGRRYQRMILWGLREADYYAFVSENTRKDLNRLFSPPVERQSIIYNQLGFAYSPMAKQECEARLAGLGLSSQAPFILHVGDNQWYKNRLGVLQLFRRLRERPHRREQLVMVGPPLTKSQTRYAERAGIRGRIIQLSNLSSEELNALYSAAALFLFPSFYEGFGWPPIEAQAAACPVVASTGGSLKETLSGSALLADPNDDAAMLKNMLNVLEDADQRNSLVEAGITNAARFAPPQMVTRYIELYRRIIEKSGSR